MTLVLLTAASCVNDRNPSRVDDIPSPAELGEEEVPAPDSLSLPGWWSEYARATIVSLAEADLAMDRLTEPGLREMAEKLRVDHRAFYNAVYRLGERLNFTIPVQVPDEEYAAVERLAANPQPVFARAWIESAIRYHEDLLSQLLILNTPEAPPQARQLLQQLQDECSSHLTRLRQLDEQMRSLQ